MLSIRPTLYKLSATGLLSPMTQSRALNASAFLLAKKSKGKQHKDSEEEEQTSDILNPKDFHTKASTDLKKILELQKTKLTEAAKGKNDVKIFDNLTVGKEVFTNLASTTQKGKNMFYVTVFDPKNTKNIVSAILAANLNLNPERIPDNEQQLKITLPPVTQESRQVLLKSLKKINDEFKAGPFANVRNKYLKELKPYGFKNENVKKCVNEIEKIHKDFTEKYQQQFKSFEKQIQQS